MRPGWTWTGICIVRTWDHQASLDPCTSMAHSPQGRIANRWPAASIASQTACVIVLADLEIIGSLGYQHVNMSTCQHVNMSTKRAASGPEIVALHIGDISPIATVSLIARSSAWKSS